MTPVFLQGEAPGWLLFHAVAGFAAVGAVTHLATYTIGLARGREPWRWRTRLFGLVVPCCFALAFALGLALYPLWRVQVRALVLDLKAPVIGSLFELKEHLAALALPLVVGAAVLARKPAAREVRWMAASLAVLGAVLVWTVALLGLYVTAARAVGGLL